MTLRNIALLSALAVVVGCQHYYQVRDPDSGKTYYTAFVHDRVGGAVSFEDARTGQDVTLQESEITRVRGNIRDVHLDRDRDATVHVRPAGSHVDVNVDPTPPSDVTVGADRSKVRINVDR